MMKCLRREAAAQRQLWALTMRSSVEPREIVHTTIRPET
jgi:hypothetical protein